MPLGIASTRVTIHRGQLGRTLAAGGVRLLSDVLESTVSNAKALCPKDTGLLANQTGWKILEVTPSRVRGEARSNTSYAFFVNTGTGLFGPLGRRIVPKRAKVLRWPARGRGRGGGRGGFVYAKSTRGMRARPYLVAGLRAAVAGQSGWRVQVWPHGR